MSRGYYEIYTLDELAEKDSAVRPQIEALKYKTPIEDILKKKEQNNELSEIWTQAYKTAAYYFDNPTYEERIRSMRNFKFNFSGLLSKTNNPNELPDLRNRNHFVSWVCKKHNEFLENIQSESRVDCSNVKKLINHYGPNYNKVKEFLGEHEYYI
jgi:hypothetical protein